MKIKKIICTLLATIMLFSVSAPAVQAQGSQVGLPLVGIDWERIKEGLRYLNVPIELFELYPEPSGQQFSWKKSSKEFLLGEEIPKTFRNYIMMLNHFLGPVKKGPEIVKGQDLIKWGDKLKFKDVIQIFALLPLLFEYETTFESILPLSDSTSLLLLLAYYLQSLVLSVVPFEVAEELDVPIELFARKEEEPVRGEILTDGSRQDRGGASDTDPTVVMTSTAPDPTNTSPIPVTATFSETVTGFVAGDITTTNGTVNNFAGTGADYTFDLTPTSQGTVTADIAAAVAQDGAGNDNTAATQFSRTYDSIDPTVGITSTAPDPTNTSPISVTATFSETVTGFTLGDISVGNGSAGNFAGAGVNYTFDVTPTTDGLVTVDIPGSVAVDNASNNNTAASQYSVTYDGTDPIVNAGTDKTTDEMISQDATASDPGSGIASYLWTQESGPGTVTFITSIVEDPFIVADTVGTYTLRLTVTDNAGNSAWNEMTFVWIP